MSKQRRMNAIDFAVKFMETEAYQAVSVYSPADILEAMVDEAERLDVELVNFDQDQIEDIFAEAVMDLRDMIMFG